MRSKGYYVWKEKIRVLCKEGVRAMRVRGGSVEKRTTEYQEVRRNNFGKIGWRYERVAFALKKWRYSVGGRAARGGAIERLLYIVLGKSQ